MDDKASALDLSNGSIMCEGKLVGRYEHDDEYLTLHVIGEDPAYFSAGLRYTERGLHRTPLNGHVGTLHDENNLITLTQAEVANNNSAVRDSERRALFAAV